MGHSSPSCGSHCNSSRTEMILYQAFIFSTPILFSLILLLLFYMLYMRRRRATFTASYIRAQFQARGLISANSERGLDKTFREMLPTVVFNESFAAMIGDTQCSVCLGDYQMNEKLLHLPVCGHAFHLDCIDKWFSNNTTCPICRTSVVQANKVVPIDIAAQAIAFEQTQESTEALPQALLPQQVCPMEGLPTEEILNMPSLVVGEHGSQSDRETCELPCIIDSNALEVEPSARSLSAESSAVKSDCVIFIKPNGGRS